MCAGTVVEPPVAVSAASVSVTSRSRSVAFSSRLEPAAFRSTLPRIGMVLRRSTTRWTWPSDFRSCARSTVTFIAIPARYLRWKSRATLRARRGAGDPENPIDVGSDRASGGPQGGADGPPAQGKGRSVPHVLPEIARKIFPRPNSGPAWAEFGLMTVTEREKNSFLQLALQRLHLFGQRHVLGDQGLDLAHGVQHRGVVASAEAAADFGQAP